jgi:hypothetical protein
VTPEQNVDFATVLNEAFFTGEFYNGVQLSSLFTKKPNSGTAKNQLNKLLESSPKYTNTILGMVLYPALKWSLYGESISDVINLAIESGDVSKFADTQKMLHDAFGYDNKLFLSNREKYYTLCHQILDSLDAAVDRLATYPEYGTQYQNVIRLILDIEPDVAESVSRFEVNKYLCDAVKVMHRLCGQDMKSLIPALIRSPIENAMGQDDENMYVYHNVKLLLREYTRLFWNNSDVADIPSTVLRAKTPAEVLRYSERGSVLYSTNIVLKFLLLIAGSIALIEYYPVNGHRYSTILKSLVSNRTVATADGKGTYVREQELAKLHNMSPARFSTMKQEAYALLGLLLWGYDGKVLMNILENNSAKVLFVDD